MPLLPESGLEFLKKREGCRLKAYPDPESPRGKKLRKTGKDDPSLSGHPWTIGWGHTGPEVHEGMVISQDAADRMLHAEVERLALVVSELVPEKVTPSQFIALVSLVYNIGEPAFRRSTLLRRLREGRFMAAANEFLVWKYSNGEVSDILVRRRWHERELFLNGTDGRVAG